MADLISVCRFFWTFATSQVFTLILIILNELQLVKLT